MHGAAGRLVGYVCVLSRARLDAGEEEFAVLRIFAARAAAELERRRHEAALRAREAEVTASRTRLLHAADEERRRIGRDLHDGAQQRLVVLGQCLDLALRTAERSPEDAAQLIAAGARAGDARRPRAARARARAASRRAERARARVRRCARSGSTRRVAAADRRAARAAAARPGRGHRLLPRRRGALQRGQARGRDRGARRAAAARPGAARRGRRRRRRRRAARAPAAACAGCADRLEALGGRLEVESAPGAGTRLRASIPLAPWRDGREPFIEFGYEGDGGSGERSIAQILDGTQDRLGLAGARVGPRGRPAEDRPAAADHRPPRQPPRGRRGDARRRAAVRPDRRATVVSAESAGARDPGASGSPATARSTRAAATRSRCCSASPAGA